MSAPRSTADDPRGSDPAGLDVTDAADLAADLAADAADELELLVAAVLDRIDPVPASALAKAYQASQMRMLDQELAALVYDSSREGDLVLTRGAEGQARLLSFANDHLSLDLSLLPDGVSLVGEVAPADAGELQIEHAEGETIVVAVDEWGRFRATAPQGPIRLRVVGRLVTPWITR